MRGFNFFRPYLKIKRTGSSKTIIIAASSIAAVLFVSLGVFVVSSFIRINAMNAQVEDMNKYMSNEKNVKQFLKYKEAKRKAEALEQYYKLADGINARIAAVAGIDSMLVAKLNSAIPQEVFLQSDNISPDAIELQGVSKSRVAIAEYHHNLKELDIFEDVFISNINTEQAGEGDYIFTVKCSLKGGASR